MSKINIKLFKEATVVCKSYGATISFGYTGEFSEVDVHERAIVIDLYEVKNVAHFWSLIFHELAHIHCFDNDIHYKFHADSLPDKEMAVYMRRMGLKVERFVDRLGKKLMREYGYTMRYVPAYNNKEDVEWLRNWIEETYPL